MRNERRVIFNDHGENAGFFHAWGTQQIDTDGAIASCAIIERTTGVVYMVNPEYVLFVVNQKQLNRFNELL